MLDASIFRRDLLPRARQRVAAAVGAVRDDVAPRRSELDGANSRRELERARGLSRLARGGTRVYEHQGLAVSPQARTEDVRELTVAERHVPRGAGSERES